VSEQHTLPARVLPHQLLQGRPQHEHERDEGLAVQLVRVTRQADVVWRQYCESAGLQESAGQVRASLRGLPAAGR